MVTCEYLPFCKDAKDEDLCRISEDYEKNYPPLPGPAMIHPTLKIIEITDTDEKRQSVSILMEIIQEWFDSKLKVKNPKKKWYEIKYSFDKVWHPNLYFNKVLSIKKIETVGKATNHALWVKTDEDKLWYRESLEVTFACENTNFSDFPIDEHECNFTFGETEHEFQKLQYNYTSFEYDFKLIDIKGRSMPINDTTTPFDFELTIIEPFHRINSNKNDYHFTGIKMKLKRNNFGPLFTTFYAPTGIFTIFSMFSFLIKPDIVPGRMGLIVTLELIMINIYVVVEAPSNRDFSFIELWIIGCQITKLIALLEYGFILALSRYSNKINDYKNVDALTLACSATFFIAFNIFYWSYIF